ncbi:MAG: NAD(P)H-hydrate dehydratase [Gemmatimonadetes bacterium]|nr:MAG: NAD(P)H-hydrate dehydratase [Gemmatimonadota bacterium]
MKHYIPPSGSNYKVVSAVQMQQIDALTINEIGIPGAVLMENAGHLTAQIIHAEFTGRIAYIFTGKGNNGGDGFVIARHLHNWGWTVKLLMLTPIDQLRGDARLNADICHQLQIPMEVLTPESLPQTDLTPADVLVDAIFGTGIKGAVRGFVAEIIEWINTSQKPVVAVDVPSGLNTDTGAVAGVCVRADLTCTMGLPKIGQLIPPGSMYVGHLHILDIGFPRSLTEDPNLTIDWLTSGYIRRLLPSRPLDAHKGSCGKVLVVAGSPGMTGAATLTCQAAYRAGAGYVTLAMPATIRDIMEIKLTEVVKAALPPTQTGALHPTAHDPILRLAQHADSLAVGPGLSTDKETQTLIHHLVETVEQPLIIDADGLNALTTNMTVLKHKKSKQLVLTPHLGEFARLIGRSIADIHPNRLEIAREKAQEWGVTIVLKGAGSIIASPTGQVSINSTGNAGMATAGSGDVLTGIIATFLAQGLPASSAAQAGVFVHGFAGDMARTLQGERSLIPSDIIQSIPKVFMSLTDSPS